MKKAILYEKKKQNYVRCTCCRHKCVISPGKFGICGVRKNINGDLYLAVYGKAVAVHTDPIEKKPLFHFMPGAEAFSLGTIGCNFRCSFCQNWDISQAVENVKKMYKNPDKKEIIIGEICEEGQDLPPRKIVEYCRENKIPIISYTYNEPTIFAEYAGDTAKLAMKHGIKNVFVSNGYESEECLEYMKDWCDAINIDIKAFTDKFYIDICKAKLKNVLKTVKEAYEKGFWIECTTLVIPNLNDSDDELKSIAEFIANISVDIPWHISAFHPDYKMTDVSSTPIETLERAWKIGKSSGLKFVYTGNIPGLKHENTYCPKCDELLIDRMGMSCSKNNLKIDDEGIAECSQCGEVIPGIWK
ncbi:AmmeMemoRadiSam system radical SAM enzyme [Candidatus Peregrinibacteria bacterium]|nr:AmmeMemoRadiSam system radical SAM enzyme [Candidatus Peregrinibacteria bacterium]